MRPVIAPLHPTSPPPHRATTPPRHHPITPPPHHPTIPALLPKERIAIRERKAADLEARRLRGMKGKELNRRARGMQITENKRNYRAKKKMLQDMQAR